MFQNLFFFIPALPFGFQLAQSFDPLGDVGMVSNHPFEEIQPYISCDIVHMLKAAGQLYSQTDGRSVGVGGVFIFAAPESFHYKVRNVKDEIQDLQEEEEQECDDRNDNSQKGDKAENPGGCVNNTVNDGCNILESAHAVSPEKHLRMPFPQMADFMSYDATNLFKTEIRQQLLTDYDPVCSYSKGIISVLFIAIGIEVEILRMESRFFAYMIQDSLQYLFIFTPGRHSAIGKHKEPLKRTIPQNDSRNKDTGSRKSAEHGKHSLPVVNRYPFRQIERLRQCIDCEPEDEI